MVAASEFHQLSTLTVSLRINSDPLLSCIISNDGCDVKEQNKRLCCHFFLIQTHRRITLTLTFKKSLSNQTYEFASVAAGDKWPEPSPITRDIFILGMTGVAPDGAPSNFLVLRHLHAHSVRGGFGSASICRLDIITPDIPGFQTFYPRLSLLIHFLYFLYTKYCFSCSHRLYVTFHHTSDSLRNTP